MDQAMIKKYLDQQCFDLVLLENMMFSKSPYMHVYALES
jgi:hypothetical protein